MIAALNNASFIPSHQQTRYNFIPTLASESEETNFIPSAEAFVTYSFQPVRELKRSSEEIRTSLMKESFSLKSTLVGLDALVEAVVRAASIVLEAQEAKLDSLERVANLAAHAAERMASASVVTTLEEASYIRSHYTIIPKRTNAYLASVYEAEMVHAHERGRTYVDIDPPIDDDGEDE